MQLHIVFQYLIPQTTHPNRNLTHLPLIRLLYQGFTGFKTFQKWSFWLKIFEREKFTPYSTHGKLNFRIFSDEYIFRSYDFRWSRSIYSTVPWYCPISEYWWILSHGVFCTSHGKYSQNTFLVWKTFWATTINTGDSMILGDLSVNMMDHWKFSEYNYGVRNVGNARIMCSR